MIEQFQKLDTLIIEHTVPPVRNILRNQLALTREQIEAYQASSDKQDHTLSTQAETIDRLMKENQNLVAQNTKLKTPSTPKVSFGGRPYVDLTTD